VSADGKSAVVLVCEHASNRIPVSLGDLGLAGPALASHIAWDPGAAAVARALSRALDAPLVMPRFSRLVYDCNRPPDAPSAMPSRSERTEVPGNRSLTAAGRAARIAEVYQPFRDTLATVLSSRGGRGAGPVLVTVHSFTPVYAGRRRLLDLGILHDSDRRLADALLRRLEREPGLAVRRNAPYGPQDGVTHTRRPGADRRPAVGLPARGAGGSRRGDAQPRPVGERCMTGDQQKAMPKAVRAYVRYVDAVNRVVGRIAMYLIFAMMGILLYSSITKTFFNPPLWALEMAQFTMVAYYLLGGGYSMQVDSHVRMDLLYDRWSDTTKAAVDAVTIFCLIVYLVMLLYGGLSSTHYALQYGEQSYSSWAPYMAPIKIIMCIGIVLMLLQVIATFFKNIAKARGLSLS